MLLSLNSYILRNTRLSRWVKFNCNIHHLHTSLLMQLVTALYLTRNHSSSCMGNGVAGRQQHCYKAVLTATPAKPPQARSTYTETSSLTNTFGFCWLPCTVGRPLLIGFSRSYIIRMAQKHSRAEFWKGHDWKESENQVNWAELWPLNGNGRDSSCTSPSPDTAFTSVLPISSCYFLSLLHSLLFSVTQCHSWFHMLWVDFSFSN